MKPAMRIALPSALPSATASTVSSVSSRPRLSSHQRKQLKKSDSKDMKQKGGSKKSDAKDVKESSAMAAMIQKTRAKAESAAKLAAETLRASDAAAFASTKAQAEADVLEALAKRTVSQTLSLEMVRKMALVDDRKLFDVVLPSGWSQEDLTDALTLAKLFYDTSDYRTRVVHSEVLVRLMHTKPRQQLSPTPLFHCWIENKFPRRSRDHRTPK
jgi:hypothetical protein